MQVFKIDLYEYFNVERGANQGGELTCYVHGNSKEISEGRIYPAMVVFPGGGYSFCSDREAEPVAEAYYAKGFNAYILRYSVAPESAYPTQLCEAAMAIAYVRRNAKAQFTNTDKIATIGFSAGGHLCGNLATDYANTVIAQKTGVSPDEARPNSAVLSYAVINSDLGSSGGTFDFLCGMNESVLPLVQIDKLITENTPPLFIWHTVNDGCVNVTNALSVATAATEKGVPYALHIFQNGEHGLSLADDRVYNSKGVPEQSADVYRWFELSVNWLRDNGFVVKD